MDCGPGLGRLKLSILILISLHLTNLYNRLIHPMRRLTHPEAATLLLRIKPNASTMSPGWEVEVSAPNSARARPLIGADPRSRTWQTKGAWVYASVPGERTAATYVWLV